MWNVSFLKKFGLLSPCNRTPENDTIGPKIGPKIIPFKALKETTELILEPSIPITAMSGSQLAKYVAIMPSKTKNNKMSFEGRIIAMKCLFTKQLMGKDDLKLLNFDGYVHVYVYISEIIYSRNIDSNPQMLHFFK